jgi:hypothetical protein
MNTTFTFTKPLANVSLFMNTIYRVFDNVDVYDYDTTNSTLKITFRNPLSNHQEKALKTLVNNYIDYTNLEPTDLLTFKYFYGYKSGPQVLRSQLNAITEITFRSSTTQQRMYYQMANNGNFIYIQKPGIYLILAKVGAKLTTDGQSGSNTVLQWGLSIDQTRTNVFYMNIMHTSVYTLHTAHNNMTDGTLIATVLNVTNATGLYLRLTARMMLGNSPLAVDSSQTNICIMNLPGGAYYEGNMTTTTSLGSTGDNVAVPLNSSRIVQYPFQHTFGSSSVNIIQDGYVLYLAKATMNKTTGDDISDAKIALLHNGNLVDHASTYTTGFTAPSNRSTAHFLGLLAVNQGDHLGLQATMQRGSSLQLTAGESGLILLYIHPMIFESMNAKFATSDLDSSFLTATPTDLVFEANSVLVPSSTQMSISAATVSIESPGTYFVIANVHFYSPYEAIRECGLYTINSVDAGKTYYYTSGSLSVKQSNPTGRVTVSNSALLSLPIHSRLKVQAGIDGSFADNIVATGSSQLSIINFERWSLRDNNSKVFGDDYGVIVSSDEVVVGSSAPREKCRLCYYSLQSGIYRFSMNFCIVAHSDIEAGIQLIDIHSDSGNTFVLYSRNLRYTPGDHYMSFVEVNNVADGSHHFVLQFSSVDSQEYKVKDVLMDCWRVI